MRRIVIVVVLAAGCRPPGYGRHDVDAAVDGVAAHDAAGDGTGDGGAVCAHAFRLVGHATAQSVWLTGDFTTWAAMPPQAEPLMLGVDGAWTGTHDFTAGTYQYKFIVDTTSWIADPTNPDQIDDGFGGKNSVFTCVP
jgi:hypothetical protein